MNAEPSADSRSLLPTQVRLMLHLRTRKPVVRFGRFASGDNSPRALINHYGLTDNTVDTTWVLVPPLADKGGFPPIGRPVANPEP
jgi:non-ribosomal peptide synthetase component F